MIVICVEENELNRCRWIGIFWSLFLSWILYQLFLFLESSLMWRSFIHRHYSLVSKKIMLKVSKKSPKSIWRYGTESNMT